MKFICSENFFSMFNHKVHVNLKPLCYIHNDMFNFNGKFDLESLFHEIKTSITKDVTQTLLSTNHPFLLNVAAFKIALGCVLFQMNDLKNWMFFDSSRSFTMNQHTICTTYREIIGFVNSPTIYEHVIISCDHSIIVFKGNKPILRCTNKKNNFFPILYTAQTQLPNFKKLRFLHTKEKVFL